MLNAEVTIAVKAVLYRNGKKLAESEDFEIPISDHYYSIEPETINQYLAPNVRTNFSPKLYKYKYSFSEQKVEKTDCKAKFNLEYDEEYDCYSCVMDLDEDEMRLFLIGKFPSCPYYRQGDEYTIVHKQI